MQANCIPIEAFITTYTELYRVHKEERIVEPLRIYLQGLNLRRNAESRSLGEISAASGGMMNCMVNRMMCRGVTGLATSCYTYSLLE